MGGEAGEAGRAGGARTVPARAWGPHTRERVLQSPPAAARVHSVFARAVNLLWHDGRLVTLHGPEPLRAPFAIALGAWGAVGELAPGEAVARRGLRLCMGALAVDLEPAAAVDLSLGPVGRRPEELLRALASAPARPGAPALSSPRAAEARRQVSEGIRQRDAAVLLRGAGRLIGLGEGLTPAGDDCLVGVLAVLHAFAAPLLVEEPSIATGVAAAARGTTLIARDFLLSAVEGRFAEPLVRLCRASHAEAGRAAADLLAVGGTSGADTLSGVRLALEALTQSRRPRRDGGGDPGRGGPAAHRRSGEEDP